jgi:poly(hydroxyalkanoate) depolymerase family esterase
MTMNFRAVMRRALATTRAFNPGESTRIIQEALGEAQPSGGGITQSMTKRSQVQRSTTLRMGLAETLRNLRSSSNLAVDRFPLQEPELPPGAKFLKLQIASASGKRDYRLYVPTHSHPRGLIVMLHGCKQTPEDFARGTDMNSRAELEGFLVAYPFQPFSANSSSCWNWFRPEDQTREKGEPRLIAEITKSIIDEYSVPPRQVFVAGLSAGGAMAAVMGATYPDLFEAIGIHSGLPYRAAHDINSAFSAMHGKLQGPQHIQKAFAGSPRYILFHGSSDPTVNTVNSTYLWEQARELHCDGTVRVDQFGAGGRIVKRKTVMGYDNTPLVERWLIEGAAHRWSGGNPVGSYTDKTGPKASAETIRFFLRKPFYVERM